MLVVRVRQPCFVWPTLGNRADPMVVDSPPHLRHPAVTRAFVVSRCVLCMYQQFGVQEAVYKQKHPFPYLPAAADAVSGGEGKDEDAKAESGAATPGPASPASISPHSTPHVKAQLEVFNVITVRWDDRGAAVRAHCGRVDVAG